MTKYCYFSAIKLFDDNVTQLWFNSGPIYQSRSIVMEVSFNAGLLTTQHTFFYMCARSLNQLHILLSIQRDSALCLRTFQSFNKTMKYTNQNADRIMSRMWMQRKDQASHWPALSNALTVKLLIKAWQSFASMANMYFIITLLKLKLNWIIRKNQNSGETEKLFEQN